MFPRHYMHIDIFRMFKFNHIEKINEKCMAYVGYKNKLTAKNNKLISNIRYKVQQLIIVWF